MHPSEIDFELRDMKHCKKERWESQVEECNATQVRENIHATKAVLYHVWGDDVGTN